MQDLKITLVQTSLYWGDAEANLRHFDNLLRDVEVTDLIILPEMFNTGFITEPGPVAETMDGRTMGWMKEKACTTGAAVTGSLIIKEDGKFYNRLIFMLPDGSYEQYNKRHLFSMAGEHLRFAPGVQQTIIEYKGWKIRPLICYDLRFPVWCKNTWQEGEYGYDLLLCVANWPEVRSHAWKLFLQSRAIENIAFVAAVNRVGNDGRGQPHSGDSGVVDPKGHLISNFEPHQEAIKSFILSKKELNDFRAAFNVGADWD